MKLLIVVVTTFIVAPYYFVSEEQTQYNRDLYSYQSNYCDACEDLVMHKLLGLIDDCSTSVDQKACLDIQSNFGRMLASSDEDTAWNFCNTVRLCPSDKYYPESQLLSLEGEITKFGAKFETDELFIPVDQQLVYKIYTNQSTSFEVDLTGEEGIEASLVYVDEYTGESIVMTVLTADNSNIFISNDQPQWYYILLTRKTISDTADKLTVSFTYEEITTTSSSTSVSVVSSSSDSGAMDDEKHHHHHHHKHDKDQEEDIFVPIFVVFAVFVLVLIVTLVCIRRGHCRRSRTNRLASLPSLVNHVPQPVNINSNNQYTLVPMQSFPYPHAVPQPIDLSYVRPNVQFYNPQV